MAVTSAATFCATLVDEWVGAGLRTAMIAPGSRSTPMALALAAHDYIHIEVFHDERSAAFAALGYGLATGRPAVVLCSSGTAGTHFHGAVVEADLASVPLLVLTADRPAELRDVGAAQTIDQTRLFGGAVRWFHDPGVPDPAASGSWRSLARRAYRSTLDTRPGPVHLNLSFREPLVGEPGPLPPGAPQVLAHASVSTDLDGIDALLAGYDRQRGVIVAGRGAGEDDASVAAVATLSAATGWPVLADPRSGCRHLDDAVWTADALLRHPAFARDHTPEVVVHVGEPWASRVVNEWLNGSGAAHLHISSVPRIIDPGHVVGQWLTGPVPSLLGRLSRSWKGSTGTTWMARWRAAERSARAAIETAVPQVAPGGHPISEPLVARTVVDMLASASAPDRLVVSSSMPIRDVEWYTQPAAALRVFSNRGANGIDGVVATSIGIALGGGPTVLLIGDVAFLHDSSSLVALARRGLDLRIVLVDNDGGGIFSFLPQATAVETDRFERLWGTPHGTDLLALVRAHDLAATAVTDLDSLREALAQPGPSVTMVRTDRASNVAVHAAIHAAVARALG
jgi:2-succinyl-5-enolpyruvyl-6-hydroxy-3-cyclohexene-1-carboxylate synthase